MLAVHWQGQGQGWWWWWAHASGARKYGCVGGIINAYVQ